MTTIEPTITLGDLVTQHPELARALEARHLDYCCGGTTSLADACAELGLDASTISAELSAVAAPPSTPDWVTLDADQLVDHLESTHHRYLWDELPRIDALMSKVLGVHGDRHPELTAIAGTVRALRTELEPHLEKEERVLFPLIRELSHSNRLTAFHCGSVSNPISVMLAEHDTAGHLLAELRTLTADFSTPTDGCASYEALFRGLEALEQDTHTHIHKENHRLFPLAVELERQLAETT